MQRLTSASLISFSRGVSFINSPVKPNGLVPMPLPSRALGSAALRIRSQRSMHTATSSLRVLLPLPRGSQLHARSCMKLPTPAGPQLAGTAASTNACCKTQARIPKPAPDPFPSCFASLLDELYSHLSNFNDSLGAELAEPAMDLENNGGVLAELPELLPTLQTR